MAQDGINNCIETMIKLRAEMAAAAPAMNALATSLKDLEKAAVKATVKVAAIRWNDLEPGVINDLCIESNGVPEPVAIGSGKMYTGLDVSNEDRDQAVVAAYRNGLLTQIQARQLLGLDGTESRKPDARKVRGERRLALDKDI